jgi:ankyrin repeat protein
VFSALFTAGFDVNKPNKAGVTPFLKVLVTPRWGHGYSNLVLAFLENGGSVTKALPDGRMPLQIFLAQSENDWMRKTNRWVRHRESHILRCFLERGTPIDSITVGEEPLVVHYLRHRHSWDTDQKLAKVLLESLDPGSDLGRGNTLLHKLFVLCRDGDRHTESWVKMLLPRGADSNCCNLDGHTPLSILFQQRRNERFTERMAQLLVESYASVSQNVILQAVETYPKSENITRLLLQAYIQHPNNTVPETDGHSRVAEDQWRTRNEWRRLAYLGERSGVKQFI